MRKNNLSNRTSKMSAAVFMTTALTLGLAACSSGTDEGGAEDASQPMPTETVETEPTPPTEEESIEEETTGNEGTVEETLTEEDRNLESSARFLHMVVLDMLKENPDYEDIDISLEEEAQIFELTLHLSEDSIDPDDPFANDGTTTQYFSYPEGMTFDVEVDRDDSGESTVTVTGWAEGGEMYTEEDPLVYTVDDLEE